VKQPIANEVAIRDFGVAVETPLGVSSAFRQGTGEFATHSSHRAICVLQSGSRQQACLSQTRTNRNDELSKDKSRPRGTGSREFKFGLRIFASTHSKKIKKGAGRSSSRKLTALRTKPGRGEREDARGFSETLPEFRDARFHPAVWRRAVRRLHPDQKPVP
jgi:hypothetical protein